MRTARDLKETRACTGLLLAIFLMIGFWSGPAFCDVYIGGIDLIAAKETELSLLRNRIERIQKNIRFEETWAEKLDAAREKLLLARDANSELGQLFRSIGNAVSEGGVDSLIQEKIARVNRLLEPEPCFRVDRKGNLQWYGPSVGWHTGPVCPRRDDCFDPGSYPDDAG